MMWCCFQGLHIEKSFAVGRLDRIGKGKMCFCVWVFGNGCTFVWISGGVQPRICGGAIFKLTGLAGKGKNKVGGDGI